MPDCADADLRLNPVGSDAASACIRIDEIHGSLGEGLRADE
jgi:hypothetical protein